MSDTTTHPKTSDQGLPKSITHVRCWSCGDDVHRTNAVRHHSTLSGKTWWCLLCEAHRSGAAAPNASVGVRCVACGREGGPRLIPEDGPRAGQHLCDPCYRKHGGPCSAVKCVVSRPRGGVIPPAALGAQLPGVLALAEACENAEVVISGIAAALESDDREGRAGSVVENDLCHTMRDAAARLWQMARALAEAALHARRERDQVVQVLDAIVDGAKPPKAPVSIRPAPRPLVRVGPGGDFTTDVYG